MARAIAQDIEQAFRWGASTVSLVGVRGDLPGQPTGTSWPALLVDLQQKLEKSRGKNAAWSKVAATRITYAQLETLLAATDQKSYVIIATCPSELSDAVEQLAEKAKEPRNVFCSWREAESAPSGLEKAFADVSIDEEAASAFDGAGLNYPLIHLAEFKDAFKAHADKGQKLDSRALGTAMRALGQAPTELELQKLIDDAAVQEIDAAGNVHESIGFKDFCGIMADARGLSRADDVSAEE